MLISHRQSAYVDNEELERAAGSLEIRGRTCEDADEAALWLAGAAALRVLQAYDLRDARDFERAFDAKVFGLEVDDGGSHPDSRA